jgi:IclR family pca regulon transcriptional regulator
MSSRAAAGEDAEPAWSIPELREPRYSQSLERGFAILGVFTPARSVLGIADLADGLGMSRSTTHRYMITLVALGYLEQDASRKYKLGLRVTDLGMSALNATGLCEHAHPYLEELRQRTSYAASLGVLDEAEVLYVDQVRSYRRSQAGSEENLRAGSRLPFYCTAMGKLLLAYLSTGEQRDLITRISSPNALRTRSPARKRYATSSPRSRRWGSPSTIRSSRQSATRSPHPCATTPAMLSRRSAWRRTAR